MHRREVLVGVTTALPAVFAGCLGPPVSRASDSMAGAVEYTLEDLSVSTSVDRPSTAYVLEPAKVYSGDAVDREEDRTGEKQMVVDIHEIEDEAVRDAVERAIETGEWRGDALPDGLADAVNRADFFTGVTEGTYTHFGLVLHEIDLDAPPALEFDAAVVVEAVSRDQPGALEFSLTNASAKTQAVFSGTVPPFGMLFAEVVESDGDADADDRFLLWRPYEKEGCITFARGRWSQCDIGKITELSPGESLSRRYEVLPASTTREPQLTAPPGPNTYRVSDGLGFSEGTRVPRSTLQFDVEFTLESG